MRKLMLLLLFLFLGCAAISLAGNSSAVLGTEDHMSGALPPPGFHYVNYDLYYTADELKNGDGHFSGPAGFEVSVFANVFRPIYVLDQTLFGAHPAWHVVVPLARQEIETDLFDDDATGLGDIYVSPLLLGWHWGNYHLVAGLDIILPTGEYDSDEAANIGNDHYTFEPALALSAVWRAGFNASIKLMYDFHTETEDYSVPPLGPVDYQTGQQFHGDYNVSYAIQPNFQLGLSGYFMLGITEDKINGEEVDNSEEQVLAFGPSILYAPVKNLTLVAKYLMETEAENRSEGAGAWLKVIYSF